MEYTLFLNQESLVYIELGMSPASPNQQDQRYSTNLDMESPMNMKQVSTCPAGSKPTREEDPFA